MAAREIRIVGPSYYLPDRKTAVQRAVNLYMSRIEGLGEDAGLVLESAPGLALQTEFGAEIIGMHNVEGALYVVTADGLLYRQAVASGGWTPPSEGEYGWPSFAGGSQVAGEFDVPFAGPVSMAHSATQLAICDGVSLWVVDLPGKTPQRVTDPAWSGSRTVTFMDGYFVFIDPNSEQWFISAIDDATNLNALDYSSADEQPDRLVTSASLKRGLYLFGERTTEVWSNTGASAFPFERISGASMDVGCVGPMALCRAADSLIFLGQSSSGGPYVYRVSGYAPERISTMAVEAAIQSSGDPSSTTMWTYKDAGAEFVCVNVPGLPTTWVWDAATGQWHERGEIVSGEWQQLRVKFCEHVQGRQYAAGLSRLYRMSRQYYDLAGDPLVRERTWPHLLAAGYEPIRYSSLEVRCTTGSEGVEGFMTLEASNDGGGVFFSPNRKSLGAVGRRNQRVRWLGLGTCPAGGSRVFRLRVSEPVPLVIQGAAINAAG